jgi:hypothetical protein
MYILVYVPDPVELLRIKRQQPALGDPSGPEAVEPNGRPTTFLATEHGRAVGKHGDVIAIPDQHLPWVQPEGSRGEVPAPGEVAHHSLDPLVVPGDVVPAGNVPNDVPGQLRAQSVLRTARVERPLRFVQSPQTLLFRGFVHRGPVASGPYFFRG